MKLRLAKVEKEALEGGGRLVPPVASEKEEEEINAVQIIGQGAASGARG